MPKLVNGVSQKMKNFCYAYLRTGSPTEAYLEAYDTTDENIARMEGNRLLKRDDITEFLIEINKPVANKVNNEREKKRQIIWKRIDECIAAGNDTAIARYMDILNRMDSEYTQLTYNVDDTGERLAGLTTDQLKQMLDK